MTTKAPQPAGLYIYPTIIEGDLKLKIYENQFIEYTVFQDMLSLLHVFKIKLTVPFTQ